MAELKSIFGVLECDEPMFTDSTSDHVELYSPGVMTVLLELEMSGLIRQLPGKKTLWKL